MKPIFHKIFNRHAVDIFVAREAPNLYGRNDLLAALNDACDFEDKVQQVIQGGFQRLVNWHFHNTNENASDFFPVLIPHFRSSVRRLRQLVELAQSDQVSESRLILAGRILHHFQDMSCPPHAVPVYHTTSDRYEANMAKYYPADVCSSEMSARICDDDVMSFSACASVNDLSDAELFYHAAARKTLEYLSKHILQASKAGESFELDLAAFWVAPAGRDFFGRYGRLGNSFGEKELSDGVGALYSVNEQEYRRVYDDLYRKVVRDSVEALTFLLPR